MARQLTIKNNKTGQTYTTGGNAPKTTPRTLTVKNNKTGAIYTTGTKQQSQEKERDVNNAGNISAAQRAGYTLSGAAKQTVASHLDAASTLYQAGQKYRDTQNEAILNDYQRQYNDAERDYRFMIEDNEADPGTWSQGDIETALNRMSSAKAKIDAIGLVIDKNVQERAATIARDFNQKLSAFGAKDTEKAKEGLGGVGRFAVDAATGLAQLGGDIAAGVATGGGATIPLAFRAFGGGTMHARQDGATLKEQLAYGGLTALAELLTERIGSVGNIQTKAFGRGGLDNIFEGVIAAAERAGKTKIGRMALNRLSSAGAGFLSEGLEEAVAAAVEPIIAKYTYGKDIPDIKELAQSVAYDFLVGGAIGSITGGIGGTNTTDAQWRTYDYAIDQRYASMADKGMFAADPMSKAGEKAGEIAKEQTRNQIRSDLKLASRQWDEIEPAQQEISKAAAKYGQYGQEMFEAAAEMHGLNASELESVYRTPYEMGLRNEEADRSQMTPVQQQAYLAGRMDALENSDNNDQTSAVKNWTGYGDAGTKAFSDILETSGLDIAEARMAFQSPYEMGVTNTPVDEARMSDLQRAAYRAGQSDRQQIIQRADEKAKSTYVWDEGLDTNSIPAEVGLTQQEINDAKYLFRALGVKGGFGKTKGNANVTDKGVVTVAADFGISEEKLKALGNMSHLAKVKKLAKDRGRSFISVLAHELAVHRTMQLAPTEFRAFMDAMYRQKGKDVPAAFGTKAMQKQTQYSRQGVSLSVDKAIEEYVADLIVGKNGLYKTDSEFMSAVRNAIEGAKTAEEAAKVEKGARTLLDSIKAFLRRLGERIKVLKGAHKEQAQQVYDDVSELKNLFETALKAATDRVTAEREAETSKKSANETGRTDDSRGTMDYSMKEDDSYADGDRDTTDRRHAKARRNHQDTGAGRGIESAAVANSMSYADSQTAANRLTDTQRREAEEIIALALDKTEDGRALLNVRGVEQTIDDVMSVVLLNSEYDRFLTSAYPGLTIKDINHLRQIAKPAKKLVAKKNLTAEDEAYFAALKSDRVKAEQMVQKAAMRAGYRMLQFHFTDADFTVFKFGELGFHVGTLAQANYVGRGRDGKMLNLYIKADSPLYWPMDIGYWSAEEINRTMDPDDSFDDFDNAEEIRDKIREISQIEDEQVANAALREYLKTLGYDSIKYENTQDRDYGDPIDDSYILFDSQQLKSADVVTYDDDRNPIPLSQRFDAAQEDIRFSLKDSEGNELTQAQAEYFKDSKVRDSKGNLKIMYHGTKSDFTVFDRGKLRDGLGFFFTEDKREAADYGTPKAAYLNITKPFDMYGDTPIEDFLGGAPKYLDGHFNYSAVVKGLREAGYDGLYAYSHGTEWYVAFDSNQIKDIDNKTPTAHPDIQYSLKDSGIKMTEEEYLDLHDVQYNLKAEESHKAALKKHYSAAESVVSLDALMARYEKVLEIWKRIGGELNSKFLEEWNNKTDRVFTIFKAQQGYKYNVELSAMCKKGVPLFEAIDIIVKKEVMRELKLDVLGKAEKEILYDILKQHNFEIPCAICYVEQARQREGVIIDAFLNGSTEDGKSKLGWNTVLDDIEAEMKANGVEYKFQNVSRSIATEKYTPADIAMDENTLAAFHAAVQKLANKEIQRYNKEEGKSRRLLKEVTPEGVKACFGGTLPSNLKIFKTLLTDPSSRFRIDKDLLYSSMTTTNLASLHNGLYGLFNAQGGVSGYKTKQSTTVYWGELLGKRWRPDIVRREGGIRQQSNSDFQMYTFLDKAQMYIDHTAKGYYVQEYTKVLAELKLFGLSRAKMNASLIPKVVEYKNADGSVDVERTMLTAGLDESGNPIYDDIEGINHAEAFMLLEDPNYSRNICGICIGYSDKHIEKLLDEPRVQMIIGFHDKTNDPDKRYRGARYAKNYNGLNEAVEDNGAGKTIHIGFNPYLQKAEKRFTRNESTKRFEGTTTFGGKQYVANDIPRLAADMYLADCAKKGYRPAYNDFTWHPNYYKLLSDTGLYDSLGQYAPHEKVAFKMPDRVPYLDQNGNKRFMPTEEYIKTELQKEMAVRDSISEALADTSENGIIPQFRAAVEAMRGGEQYSLKVETDMQQEIDQIREEGQRAGKSEAEIEADTQSAVVSPYRRSINMGDVIALEELRRENKKLQAQVERLKGQTKRTTTPTLRQGDVDKLARRLVKDYDSTLDWHDITEDLKSLGEYMMRGGEELTWSEVKERAMDIGRKLVNSAQVLVDGELEQDLSGLKSYLRSVKLAYEDTGDIPDFNDWRKRHFGKFTISKDGLPVDVAWMELQSMFGELYFPADIINPTDQLLHITQLLVDMQSVMENPYSADMDQAIQHAANAVIDGLLSERVRQSAPTFADRQAAKIDAVKAKNRESTKRQLDRVRADRDAKIKALKDKHRAKTEEGRERQNAKELRRKIEKHVAKLSQKLRKPSDNKHIPQKLRGAVSLLLEAIDLESSYEYVFGKDGIYHLVKRDTELVAEPTNRTKAAEMLRDYYQKVALEEAVSFDPDLLGDDGNLAAVIGMRNLRIADMNSEQLSIVWKTIRAVEKSITEADKMLAKSKFKNVHALADAIRESSQSRKLKGNWRGVVGFSDKMLNIDMLDSLTFLHQFGDGGDALYNILQQARDDRTRILAKVVDYTNAATDGIDVRALQKERHTFTTERGDKVTLTTAQLMALYALNQREQARKHIYGGGIRPTATSTNVFDGKTAKEKLVSVLGKVDAPAESVRVTENDVKNMLSIISKNQDLVDVVNSLTGMMSGFLAEEGNKASMAVYGYEKFGEANYFPISSDPHHVQSKIGDMLDGQSRPKSVSQWGSAKQTDDNANNALMVGDIFDIVSQHSIDMATYASHLAAIEDIERVRNFVFRDDAGSKDGTMEDIIQKVTGIHGPQYLEKLLQDVSGSNMNGNSSASLVDMMSNAKAAKVGMNIRVVLQQPTSYIRAAALIDPKYLTKAAVTKGGWDKALKYAPIARWKDWGSFEINQGPQLGKIMFGTDSKLDKVRDWSMALAGKADAMTWGALWNACELEMADTRTDLQKGTEEFYEAVAQRFTEVVDKTQVVDNVLGRSQIMRQKDMLHKMATSFLGEPTKQYNMLFRAYTDYSRETDVAKRAEAKKALRVTVATLTITALVNAVAQAIPDAGRDDDPEEKYWERFASHILPNFADNMNIAKTIPYVKDIVSLLEGYDVKRMDTQLFADLISSCAGLYRAMNGEGRYTVPGSLLNVFASAADVFGLPASTIKRDAFGILRSISAELGDYEFQYNLAKVMTSVTSSSGRSELYAIMYAALNAGDVSAYRAMLRDMVRSGIKEDDISSAMRSRYRNRREKESGYHLTGAAKKAIGLK